MKCKNCNAEVNSKFCPECGQPTELKRIDGSYILREIEQVFYFERGILYTIKELTTNPGPSIKNYLTGNRNKLVKPIIFIIIASLIYTISVHFFNIEDTYVKFEEHGLTTSKKIFAWIQEHYGYANLVMGVFIAFWTKLFFKKHQFNFYEILVLLCFVMGIAMFIYSIFALFEVVTNVNLMAVGGIMGIGYSTWAIGQFFGKNRVLNYVKAFLAYILGMATFLFGAVYTGVLIDVIMNH